MKKHLLKTFTPLSAVAAVFGLAASAQAQTTPVFQYTFPNSWNGTGTTVTDQSAAGNNGTVYNGSTTALALDAGVPAGAPSGAQSINTVGGALTSGAASSLANSTVAAAGGFTYDVSFMWNGADSTSWGHTQKIIDYAGTESLQLLTASGSAALQMAFANNAGVETVAASTTILPNTWYNVELTFNTAGNDLDANGDISGTAALYVNGSLASWGAATKGTYGDSLARPIGVGELGSPYGHIVYFRGDIYNPSVSLGAVPEPSTIALGALGGLALLGARRRKS